MNLKSADDVRVRVQVVLGEKDLTIRDLASLGEGVIIELDSMAGEPVELRAAGKRIGWGEVVIIDENFGIRVTELARAEARP
ncbi:MAG: hypothetical protein A2Z99_11455 [Treponema sp. GWB1_62_6]|nr:MAG: hypothetical protein A2001_15045 [Treponema sp. GWC1_61_84]OHE69040.1 MAG: hypothetical protein A2Z99_11455 [Treponema sp. GWB1_62_6]HCM24949.1 hypothetical protein [Treponema sp.]